MPKMLATALWLAAACLIVTALLVGLQIAGRLIDGVLKLAGLRPYGFVILSLALGALVSPYWYLFTAFVGLNLMQSSFTNLCALERILGRFGLAFANFDLLDFDLFLCRTAGQSEHSRHGKT